MSETQETVASVLEAVEDPACGKMYHYVQGDDVAGQAMDYEDWVRPLKLTGGQVCLRAEDLPYYEDYYVTWRPEGLKLRYDNGEVTYGVPAAAVVREDTDMGPEHFRPVLREDTPFREADHD